MGFPPAYSKPQIYHRLKALFVHVPKTAGTSIEHRLREFEGGLVRGHTPAVHFRDSFPKEFATYFKFAFVRNPLDRFISAYSFLKHESEADRNIRFAQECGTIDVFAQRIWKRPGFFWDNVHLVPQHQFICSPQGAILMDAVYHYEDLENAWGNICRHIGIPANPLPKVNVSPRVGKHEVTEAVLAVVRSAYVRDFELFGYAPP